MVKLSKMATNGTQLGTFAPLWEVFRISSDKLALCHLELMKKLHDLIKEISRYGEEQGRVHKKVALCPLHPVPVPSALSPARPAPRRCPPAVQGGGGGDAGGRAAPARRGPAAAQVQGELPQQVPGVRAAAQGGHQPEGDRQGDSPRCPRHPRWALGGSCRLSLPRWSRSPLRWCPRGGSCSSSLVVLEPPCMVLLSHCDPCPLPGVPVPFLVSLSPSWCPCPLPGVPVPFLVSLFPPSCPCPLRGVPVPFLVSLSPPRVSVSHPWVS
uniref:Uncharacterized protein n=1 Tax=Cyanistes caeruleus TaxID=156563 RepID=A0A8C0V8B6_CYACU